jgi:hypothetical protein
MANYDIDQNDYIAGRMRDKGCARATKFLKSQSTCQHCPFPCCMDDIEYHQRKNVMKSLVEQRTYATA